MAQQNKVALVTGAGSGIGKTTALRLLADGYQLVLTGRRLEPLTEAAAESGILAIAHHLAHALQAISFLPALVAVAVIAALAILRINKRES